LISRPAPTNRHAEQAPVHRNLVQPRQHGTAEGELKHALGVRRGELAKQVHAAHGQRGAEHAANRGEHEALGDELPYDAAAAGADGQTHGDLLAPCRPPRQQQAGDVGADDQQHGADRDGDHLQRRPARRHDLLLDPLDRKAPDTGGKRPGERAGRRLRAELFADGIRFVGRRRHGRVVPQAGDDVAAERSAGGRSVADRYPIVQSGQREVEAGRHHADNGQRRAVEESRFRAQRLERDGAPEDVRVALKVSLPRAGADDHHVRAGGLVRGGERAPEPRLRPQHREGVGRHQRAGQARGA
jgi:hypothetical protein